MGSRSWSGFSAGYLGTHIYVNDREVVGTLSLTRGESWCHGLAVLLVGMAGLSLVVDQ